MREEQHIADACRVRQKHHETVDTDTAATRGRKTEFKGADVVSVVVHGFIVTVGLGVSLSLKASGLVFRVI